MNYPTLEDELKVLEIAPTLSEDVRTISDFINDHFAKKRNETLKILEAGCGQKWTLKLSGLSYELTGIDLSPEAIEFRQQKYNDLDQVIIGDLATLKLPYNSFDLIYSSYVLEHIDGAEKVLENFLSWLRPGGLLVMRIPDPITTYSFLSKVLPFWLHIALRRATGSKNAGKPGYDPFPTFFDPVVSRHGIHHFCQAHGLKVRVEYSYSLDAYKQFISLYPIANLAFKALSALSFGKLSSSRIDLLFIIEK